MLSGFETRLADVIGLRLPPPLAGTVDVAPGQGSSRIVVGITSAVPTEDSLLNLRPERVPGAPQPRRVLKLHCEVVLTAKTPANVSRADQMQAIEGALYALDDSAMRNGSALLPGDNSDPGFLIRNLEVTHSAPPDSITLGVDGFFWPAGTPGTDGTAIQEARIRSALQPVALVNPQLTAGGAAVDLQLTFGGVGTMIVKSDGVTGAAFGSLIVRVIDAGGRPGAGTLSGGSAGPNGARTVVVAEGGATVTYTPPAQPAADVLVVAMEDNAGGAGVELGRFPLSVRSQ